MCHDKDNLKNLVTVKVALYNFHKNWSQQKCKNQIRQIVHCFTLLLHMVWWTIIRLNLRIISSSSYLLDNVLKDTGNIMIGTISSCFWVKSYCKSKYKTRKFNRVVLCPQSSERENLKFHWSFKQSMDSHFQHCNLTVWNLEKLEDQLPKLRLSNRWNTHRHRLLLKSFWHKRWCAYQIIFLILMEIPQLKEVFGRFIFFLEIAQTI
jgi:hypothetical protein